MANCNDSYLIHDKIALNWVKLLAVPEDVHILCPKMKDDDEEDYDDLGSADTTTLEEKQERLTAAKERLEAVAWCSMVLAILEENSRDVLGPFIQRTSSFLTKCDRCVRCWHAFRKPFRAMVMREFGEDTEFIVARKVREFDRDRIQRGLAEAVQILDTHGPMSSIKLMKLSEPAVIAFYEALCDMENMGCPENRGNFNIVFERLQEKRVLKVGATVLPIMARYIFEELPIRRVFAKTAWERLSQPSQPFNLTTEQFDWAVNDHLAKAIEDANHPVAPDSQVEAFWDGFLVVLDAMSEDLILHSLRGMQIPVDVYALAMNHLARDSPRVLALVVKALCMLMEKSKKAFWDALAQLPPPQLAGFILSSPAFVDYANMSCEESMQISIGNKTMPSLVAFVTALMRSLGVHQRTDVCESLLEVFMGRNAHPKARSLPQQGKTACLLAVITGLQITLDGFQEPGYEMNPLGSMPYLNPVINCAYQHREMIIWAAEKDQVTDNNNQMLSEVACRAIQTALTLDAQAFRVEWKRLENGMMFSNHTIERRSGELWLGYVERLKPGKLWLARAMLMATLPLRGVQTFSKAKGELKLSDERLSFNKRFLKMVEGVTRAFERLSDFSIADLTNLCEDATLDPIVAAVVHGEGSIRDAGSLLLYAVTGQDSRTDAITRMVHHLSARFLLSFSETVDKVTVDKKGKDQLHPWAPMHHILTSSRDVLEALCDTTLGMLRTGVLTKGQQDAVMLWWYQQWQFVDYAFRRIKPWSTVIEKTVMENFARDVIELSHSLLEQDGLIASALGSAQVSNPDDGDSAMVKVLRVPRGFTGGIVFLIALKDTYLLTMVVKVLVKLLTRLREFEMEPPTEMAGVVRRACIRNDDGKFSMNTNLADTQRAELMKALGEEEPEVMIIDPATIKKSSRPKKTQSTIESWTHSGLSTPTDASTSAAGYGARDTSSITPNVRRLPKLPQSKPVVKPVAKPDNKAFLANRKAAEQEKQRQLDAVRREQKAFRERLKAGSGTSNSSNVQASAPQKSDMMVDSDQSESDYDEEEEEEDPLTVWDRQGDEAANETDRHSKAIRNFSYGPVKKIKVVRSAKDMKARLIPPMGKLHQAVLEWDIFHEGDDPPNGYKCENVAGAYPSPKEYKDTFFPLLVSEAWRSFVTAKDETTSKPFGIKVLSRMTVDSFLEVSTSVPVAVNKDRMLSEGDIVLLGKNEDPLKPSSRDEPYSLARISKIQFKKEVIEVVYRLSNRSNPMMPLLAPSMEFHGVKITNMTTIEREFAALESLQYYDLMGEILSAQPARMLNYSDDAIAYVQRNWGVNRAQGVAIKNAKDNDGFTLVQGPPGTGKTKTIIAMVGAILTSALNKKAGAVSMSRPGQPQASDQGMPKKLLVCAPSNAAVDELVLRLKAGVKDSNGVERKINVLRLGRSEAINAAVRDVTLDELVKNEIEGPQAQANGKMSDRETLHKRAGEIKNELMDLRPALEAAADRQEEMSIQRKIDTLRTEQRTINSKIQFEKDSGNTYAREAQIRKIQVQQKILNEAHVLCATLSGSGHEMFKNLNIEFETVIIDEAAQCVELSALIPLKYGCLKCILVGDPKQLPPTVLSQSAAKYGYDQSLFVRMQENNPQAVHLLDTQYRMHPDISRFPSQVFYEQKLIDGGNMAAARRQAWHRSLLLGPYRFFDVEGVQSHGQKGRSLVNIKEIHVAMQLYKRLCTDYGYGIDLKRKIGIITPYKAQLHALRETFVHHYGNAIAEEIEFNTTDAFQGRECEIIIFSCVRASATGGIGFMTDIRRMNVGLTRAKSSLWVLGNSKALSQGRYWKQLIDDAQARGRYTTGDIMQMLSVPGRKVDLPSLESSDTAMNHPSPPIPDVAAVTTDLADLFPRSPPRPEASSDDVEMADLPKMITPSTVNPTTTTPGTIAPPSLPPSAAQPTTNPNVIRPKTTKPAPTPMKPRGAPPPGTASAAKRRAPTPDPTEVPIAKKPAVNVPPPRPDTRSDPSALQVLNLPVPGHARHGPPDGPRRGPRAHQHGAAAPGGPGAPQGSRPLKKKKQRRKDATGFG